MKEYFILTIFILLFVFETRTLSADLGIAYTDFERDYLLSFTTSPELYNDLLRKNQNREMSFFHQNLKIKMRSIKSHNFEGILADKSLAVESELKLLKNLKILGELRSEIPRSEDSEPGDYSLQVGPSVKIKSLNVWTGYRKKNGEGLFFDLDYKPWRQLSFSASGDREWIDDDIKTHGLFEMSLGLFSSALVTTGVDVVDLNSREDDDSPRTVYTYFARLSNNWGDYTTFIDYSLEGLYDVGSSTNTLTAGINRIWTKIEAWVKGGLARKDANVEKNGYFGELGFNYNPFKSFEFQFENSYHKFRSDHDESENIKLSGGINFKLPLPFGIKCQNSIKVSRITQDEAANYQFMASITIPRL